MQKLSFGNRIKLARGSHHWTLDDLAQRTGISTTAIRNLEAEVSRRPHIRTIILLAEALELDPAELLKAADELLPRSPVAPVQETA